MKGLYDIEREIGATETIVDLSSAFEGIASLKIAKIKDQVLQSTSFFDDLWSIYEQLRVDKLFRFGRQQGDG